MINLKSFTLHINLYDVAFFGMIGISLTFIVLLGFTRRANGSGNCFLAMALAIATMWVARIPAIDIGLPDYFPLPLLLAFGPLLFFYVLKTICQGYKFRRKDLLHLSPLLLEPIRGALWNAALQCLAFISIIIYIHYSRNLIEDFYRSQEFKDGDRYRHEWRWLHQLLTGFGLLWLLWVPVAATGFFYYPLNILLFSMMIWIAAKAHLRPEPGTQPGILPVLKPLLPFEIKQKGVWLKNAVKSNRYYEDPQLSLNSLAGKLDLHPHELSRIINTVLKKNFNDFINEYRVQAVARKMQDPAYDHITLLGIAFESGFNSQSTFTRIFKQIKGKSPLEYKNERKKDYPSYNLGSYPGVATVISYNATTLKWSHEKSNRNFMLKNYFKMAWRGLIKNKIASLINIGGLSVGMAVALLISLWVLDELTFNQYHDNYKQIAQVLRQDTRDGERITSLYQPIPLAAELRNTYGSNFKYVVTTRQTEDHLISIGDKKFTQPGSYMEKEAPDMLSLKMLNGSRSGLQDPHSILLSASLATKIFGGANPVGHVLNIDHTLNVKVTGVYEDLPDNSNFKDASFIAPFDLYVISAGLLKSANDWGNQNVHVYVQLKAGKDFDKISAQIKNLYISHINPEKAAKRKPAVILQPMNRWHLYSKFENDVNVMSDELKFVWFYGIIGAMVLLMACINFMNLSTARSQKRAVEVGIRKSIGSKRSQLILQFYFESLLVAVCSFVFAIAIVQLALHWFNTIAGKSIILPGTNPLFWIAGITFVLITGLLAGSYPALYLSAFEPTKVIKGTFSVGRFATLPRKILVIVQFTFSIALIIGTITIYRQIQFTRNRPIGYSQANLVTLTINSPDYNPQKYEILRNELKKTGAITEMSESASPLTGVNSMDKGFSWAGKDPDANDPTFNTINITPEYGETIGWKFASGRDFSRAFSSDSSGLIINEAAAKLMGMQNPVGKTVTRAPDFARKTNYTIIGVVKDMIMESPYSPVNPTVYFLQSGGGHLFFKINPHLSAGNALNKIENVFKSVVPDTQFDYKFVDEDYAAKFAAEERIGKLAGCFTSLAIFISCIGLFGMAAFMAEQRKKEIGVRKVLGASVFGLWRLLSKEFVTLIIISLLIAIPIAYYFMHSWLQNYSYRANLSWWIFAVSALGTITITLLTVSYQSIKAALVNPVKSLRSE